MADSNAEFLIQYEVQRLAKNKQYEMANRLIDFACAQSKDISRHALLREVLKSAAFIGDGCYVNKLLQEAGELQRPGLILDASKRAGYGGHFATFPKAEAFLTSINPEYRERLVQNQYTRTGHSLELLPSSMQFDEEEKNKARPRQAAYLPLVPVVELKQSEVVDVIETFESKRDELCDELRGFYRASCYCSFFRDQRAKKLLTACEQAGSEISLHKVLKEEYKNLTGQGKYEEMVAEQIKRFLP